MDICDDCGINPANVHLTHVENNEAQTFHLCEDCARKRGLPLPDGDSLIKGLAGLTGTAGAGGAAETHVKVTVRQSDDIDDEELAEAAEAQEPDIKCPNCGMLFSQFRSGGWLGCAECYGSFDERIHRILVQIHGSDGHKGKRYGKPAVRRGGKRDMARLRRELDDAIKNERFEDAALIRDTIISMKTDAK
ncbi:MAG: UvrB/UvrC motif-containing protein [Chitinispirillia bacterium]|nr:UvrB/UvrC motif-containing protein [Chitinispirillia bacterium]MCL2267901.1 UvrB/UvrC motif-containing protein [Chitinispirillia bacterium]